MATGQSAQLPIAGAMTGWRLGLATAGMVVLAAMLSIALSGHVSGYNNNIFQMAILERLYDEPQFRTDVFVQSLRHYASGFWQLFAGAADDATLMTFFLPLQIASRTAFFAGVAMIARPLGLSDWRQQFLLLLFVALATTMRGTSYAGGGGLFILGFTHSELANATVLISLALAARQRFGWAVAAAGATFFCNIFMAVWLALPLAVLMGLALRCGDVDPARLARQLLPGLLVCLPFVLPVLANLLANPEFGAATSFDYRHYLEEYWPEHFLVWTLPPSELAKFACVAAAGAAAALLHPAPARNLLLILLGCFALIWVVGAILPFVTASQTLINLHMLRAGAMIQIFASIALAGLAARLFFAIDPMDRLLWAPALLVLFAVRPVLVPLVVVFVLLRSRWSPPRWLAQPLLALAMIALVIVGTASKARWAATQDRIYEAHQRDWAALAAWVRAHSAPDAILLLPVENIRPDGPLPASAPERADLLVGSEPFITLAHRRIWIGGKQGAAVMWKPSYYAEWRSRLLDVLGLQVLPDRLSYARSHGISVVVDRCDQPGGPVPAFRSGPLCAFAVDGNLS